jgi:hypothetical protein
VIVLLILAVVVDAATLLLCLFAGFLLAVYVLPSLPWVPIAAAVWLTIQLIAGLKSAVKASKKQTPQ